MTTRLVALFDRMAPPLAGGSVPFKDATHRTSRGLSCALSLLVLLACPAGAAELLFVVRDAGSLSTQDTARVTQFEAWGHTVTLIDDSDSQANFDTALATAEVVYVTEEVSSAAVNYKLRETTVGVVSEEQALLDELGLATASSDPGDHGTLSVIDNGHPITSAFSVGSVSFSSPDADVSGFDATLAPDLHVLGNWSSTPAIGVIEAGETLVNTYNGSDIALGRRVGIPLGSNFDWGDLTADGLLLLQNAVTWAVGTDGLVGHWKLDETSGTVAADSSGNGNDGTYQNSPTLGAEAVYGKGAEFDGVDQHVEIPGTSINPTSAVTVSCWAKSDTATWNEGGFLVSKRSQFILHPIADSTEIRFFVFLVGSGWQSVSFDLSTISGFSLTSWHHYAGTYDSATGNAQLYVDGVLRATQTVAVGGTNINSGTNNLYIGYDWPHATRYFNGQMDEVRLYRTALSDEEIAELYGLVGHWKLNETSGTTAADSSGTEHHGTYTNGPTLAQEAPYPGYGDTAQFDGTDDHVDLGVYETDFTQGLTFALWAKPTAVNNTARFIELGDGADNGNLILTRVTSTNDLRVTVRDGSLGANKVVDASEAIELERWQHFVVTIDSAGQATLFKNGVVIASQSIGVPADLVRPDCFLGRSTYAIDDYYQGGMADVRILNRAISAAEVAELYGLVGHWKFDETSGTVAADSSSSGNDGAFNGSADWSTEGIRIGAVDVDGSESVEVPAFSLGGSTLSLGAWVKPETLSNEGRLLMKSSSNSGADQSWGLTIDDTGDVELRVNAGGSLDRLYAYGAIAAGRWQQVLGTYDGTTMRLYIDGALASSQAHSVGGDLAENAADIITIGNSPVGGREIDGLIDDVVVYNRAMTAQEIAEHYGLIGHWDFDEGSGTTVAESTGVGSDATFSTGTPEWIDGVRGKALKFDGTNDAQTDDDFDPPETGAVAFWYRRDGDLSDQERPFGLGGDWEARQEVGGRMAFDLGSSPYVGSEVFQTTSVSPDPMRWRHIVAQFVAETDAFEVYVDGQLDTSGTNTRDMVKQAAAKLSFGARTGSTQRFNGALDDFRIYNRWLDDAEIAKLYGLVGHWKLDETGGSVAADSSGMGQDGTINSSPTMLIDGPRSVDFAMNFDGVDDHVILPTYDLDFSDGFAMSTWARPTSSAHWARFMELGNGPSADNIVFARQKKSNNLRVHVFHGSSVTGQYEASGALVNDVWRHYAVSTDAQGDYDIYVDGVRVETLSGVLPQSLSRTDNYIGRSAWSSDDYYKGDLTDVRLYNRPLTPEEARALYYGEYTPGLRIVRWVEVANP